MVGKFSMKCEWTGMKLTLSDLRQIVDSTTEVRGETIVSVHIDRGGGNPLDTGGQITLKMEL